MLTEPKVSASVTAVADKQWKTICSDCSGSIDSLVELLQGKLSKSVMERICKPGAGLFPSPKEIKFACSCPDWAAMCKHVAAVLYGIGARLDEQPELIFSLRRVDAKDLVSQAGAGLTTTKKRMAPGRALDDALLADVFGIEMAEVLPPAKRSGRSIQSAVKAAPKNAVKRVAPATRETAATAKTAARKQVATGKAPAKPSAAMPSAPESTPRKIQRPQSAPT